MTIYYNPKAFYGLIFAVRGSVLPHVLLHALFFAGIGAVAAYLVETGVLQHDVESLTLACGVVMSLLLTFRLNFSFARYEEGVRCMTAIQGSARIITARLCAFVEPGDVETVQSVLRIRRWLTLTCLLCKARVRAEEMDFGACEQLGLVTAEERQLMERAVSVSHAAGGAAGSEAASGSSLPSPGLARTRSGSCVDRVGTGEPKAEHFPTKARSTLIAHLIWCELAAFARRGTLPPAHVDHLSNEVAKVADVENSLDALMAKLLPFSYANFIKTVLWLYVASFPFSVAVELGWLTPVAAFVQSAVFLGIDRVGAVMDVPFAASDDWGIDLEKRCRRIDKESSALVGVWLGRPCSHFDLFPESSRSSLPRRFHEDNVMGGRRPPQSKKRLGVPLRRSLSRHATNSKALRQGMSALTAPLVSSASSSGSRESSRRESFSNSGALAQAPAAAETRARSGGSGGGNGSSPPRSPPRALAFG